jgi:hypothetical protein
MGYCFESILATKEAIVPTKAARPQLNNMAGPGAKNNVPGMSNN